MGMGAATAALGLTGLGFGTTTAQAADQSTSVTSAASTDRPEAAFEANPEQYKDFRAGHLVEGPGAPDQDHPGAKLSPDEYQRIAQLDNASFIQGRNRVLSMDAADDPEHMEQIQQLQRSLYSNGCTGVSTSLVTQQELDACIQHDFRYTVGPNVYGEDTEEGMKERAAADSQLADNFGGLTGQAVGTATGIAGGSFYRSTPTG